MNDREQEILDVLSKSYSSVSIQELASRLYLSVATVRRHLASLAEKGLIIRTHGSAEINYNLVPNASSPIQHRIGTMSAAKNLIAKNAAVFLQDGFTVFLDHSSTVYHLLPYLRSFHNLTVFTNSIKTTLALAEMNIPTIASGGNVCSSTLACCGSDAIENVKKINADILFFSCDALSDEGVLSDNSSDSCYLRRQFMENAKIKVLLLDNTKLHRTKKFTLCSLKDVNYCICNDELPLACKQLLSNQ